MTERPQIDKERGKLVSRLSAISSARAAAPPVAAVTPQRRNEPREPTYRFATVLVGRQAGRRCIVRDISATGARIAMEGAHELPAQVILAIGQTGRRYRARVAWRSEQEAGLCFIGEVLATETKNARPELRRSQSEIPADQLHDAGEV